VKFSEIELPSNRKFGFFFTFVFAAAAAYFFYAANITWTYVFVTAVLIFLLITLIKSDALLPLNKLWMRSDSSWNDSKSDCAWSNFLWLVHANRNADAFKWT